MIIKHGDSRPNIYNFIFNIYELVLIMILVSKLAELASGKCSGIYVGEGLLNRYGGLNEVVVQVALGRLVLCSGSFKGSEIASFGGVLFTVGEGDVESDCAIVPRRLCEKPIPLTINLPEVPRIIIDVSFWRRHTKGELESLITQIVQGVREVRRYLWDGNLVLSGVDDEFKAVLSKGLGSMLTSIKVYGVIPPEYLKNAVMLDPYGDFELTESIVRSTDTFILGGISDSEIARKGETSNLYRWLGLDKYAVPRVRISLRGVLTGVPERINKIVSIILMVRYSGYTVEDAVIANQSKADKIARLHRELQVPSHRDVQEILAWLGLTPWDPKVIGVLRKHGLL